MAQTWRLQDAKDKLPEVVAKAAVDGPQTITRRGAETAVVMSYADYKKLLVAQDSVSTFFRNSPLAELPVDLTRTIELVPGPAEL